MENINNYLSQLIEYRRNFHRYPEPGWCEYRTTYIIYKKLKELGYNLKYGKSITEEKSRFGVPDSKTLEHFEKLALESGIDKEFLEEISGGYTGVIAELELGEGPTVAFRFDIDCVPVQETSCTEHLPNTLGFSSTNDGYAHSCGHDGHMSIGLVFAEIIARNKELFKGKIILIFQPAEEGVRGAKAIIDKSILPKIDYMFGGHLALSLEEKSSFSAGSTGFLASRKFDVILKGKASHAANSPENGINALLAATGIINGFNNIPRHSQGSTMVNVGVLKAGSSRNVIPENAEMQVEVRGENNELCNYMFAEAANIVENISKAYKCQYKILEVGSSLSENCSSELVDKVYDIIERSKIYNNIHKVKEIKGSEDYTYFMKHIKENGGQATYMLWGADIKDSFHGGGFDFSEESMINAVKSLYEITKNIL